MPTLPIQGPALIGTFLNVALFGIMLSQCFFYFTHFKKDKLGVKLYVSFLLLANAVNCATDIWWIYEVLINQFGNWRALSTANWVFATDPALVGIIGCTVQLFFAWRIWVLSSDTFPWIPILLGLISLASGLGGIGSAIAVSIVPEFTEFQRFKAIVIVWLASSALCDTAIALSLSTHLQRHKTGITATDSVVDRIIRATIQNGLMTAMCAIIDLVLFLALPGGLHLIFNIPLGNLYSCTLMSTLCSRSGMGFERSQSDNRSEPTTVLAFADPRSSVPEVFVGVESHELSDVDSKLSAKVSQRWMEEA